ncbi:hypothetical protein BDW62DRAFT_198549 [Aspergillus aurantiobrunneus]
MAYLVGEDIFTGQTREEAFQYIGSADIPIVKEREYHLDAVDDGYLVLEDSNGLKKDDVRTSRR